jgi:hypothetical protein
MLHPLDVWQIGFKMAGWSGSVTTTVGVSMNEPVFPFTTGHVIDFTCNL